MAALLIDTVLVAVLLNLLIDGDSAMLIILAGYGAVMWKLKGTTIGGIVFGLKVVRVDGRPIDWATATVRALSCFLSLVVAGLGFIWIAFDPGRQAWHDKIAGTAVVRVPKGVSLL
ncbi:MAG: RDD family protein [Steroidobacteraceae bacterium]|nr:RDD family protein [Steroidobacteraceae bacterium]